METPKTLKEANLVLFKRYLRICKKVSAEPMKSELKLVIDMCNTVAEIDMYEDKQSRWLGFVQGVMYSKSLIDVEEERNYSRKLFHSVYEKNGLDKPDTISL